MRGLSEEFMKDLKDQDGLLYLILERVKHDHTLMLAIRENCINIYYRGGNILKLTEQKEHVYNAFFAEAYNKTGLSYPKPPSIIKSINDAKKWVEAFKYLKEFMDFYFVDNKASEREFQQLVVRENNFSPVANDSEYFMIDIEFTDSSIGARFDMLAIQWLAHQRKSTKHCRPVLIEMKYSDSALTGESGILKHLMDIDKLISDTDNFKKILKTMASQFNQLDELGLLTFNHTAKWTKLTLDDSKKPEVIFMFANHNSRSTKLLSILKNPKINDYSNSSRFDLRFSTETYAGYALHTANMLTLNEFCKSLEKNQEKAELAKKKNQK